MIKKQEIRDLEKETRQAFIDNNINVDDIGQKLIIIVWGISTIMWCIIALLIIGA